MEPIRQDHPLRRLFTGLVEHAFCVEVGMCDPALTEYLADLLVEFTHIDRFRAVRRSQDKRLDQIATVLVALSGETPETPIERDRAMYKNIGDYTLFWAGVYPEQLRCSPRPSDVLLNYISQGKRSYAIVSQLAREDDTPAPSLFRHLSDDFEFCLYGLGLVRRGWERSTRTPGCDGRELLY